MFQTLHHPPYYPELAPSVSYLFSRLKSALKGRRFCDATDVINDVTEELKRLSQNGFLECLRHLYSYLQTYIVAQGDFFEGNVA